MTNETQCSIEESESIDLFELHDSWPKGGIAQGKVEVYRDLVAEKLDEMADISEYWKKNRNKGRNPNAIRAAMLMLCEECISLSQIKERS